MKCNTFKCNTTVLAPCRKEERRAQQELLKQVVAEDNTIVALKKKLEDKKQELHKVKETERSRVKPSQRFASRAASQVSFLQGSISLPGSTSVVLLSFLPPERVKGDNMGGTGAELSPLRSGRWVIQPLWKKTRINMWTMLPDMIHVQSYHHFKPFWLFFNPLNLIKNIPVCLRFVHRITSRCTTFVLRPCFCFSFSNSFKKQEKVKTGSEPSTSDSWEFSRTHRPLTLLRKNRIILTAHCFPTNLEKQIGIMLTYVLPYKDNKLYL